MSPSTTSSRGLSALKHLRPVAVSAVVIALAPLIGFGPRVLHLLSTVAIYSIVVTSLQFLYRYGGQLSVAQGALWGIGAYAGGLLVMKHGWNFALASLVAVVCGAFLACIIGYPSLRVRGHYFLIVTFAFAEVLRLTTVNLASITGGNTGLSVTKRPELPWPFSLDDRIGWYWVTTTVLVACLLLVHSLALTPFGRRLTAVREEENLATSIGINTGMTKLVAFGISGGIAAFAGVLWAFNQRFVHPDQFGAFAGIDFILMLMLGGARSIAGPILGALLVVFLPDFLHLTPTQNEIALGATLILIILLLPDGLGGSVTRLGQRLLGRRSSGMSKAGLTPLAAGAVADGVPADLVHEPHDDPERTG